MKWMMRILTFALIMAGSTAWALNVNAVTGEVEDWGFTPFGTEFGDWTNGSPPLGDGVAGYDYGNTGGTSWIESNNTSFPIDYPGGPPDYVVSGGEEFDLEMVSWRLVGDGTVAGSSIQILAISSMDPNAGVNIYDGYHVGDLFIDVDGNDATGYNGWDAALTAGQWDSGNRDPLHLADGDYSHQMDIGLYGIDDVDDIHGITDEHGWGAVSSVADLLNPFAIRDGATKLGDVGYEIAEFDYGLVNGADEDGTWLIEWTISAELLGLDLGGDGSVLDDMNRLTFHWTTECGNDWIPTIPEPATLALMGLGLASVGLLRRRTCRG